MLHNVYAAGYVAAANPIGSAIGHISGWLEGILLIVVVVIGIRHLGKGNTTMVFVCAVIGIVLLSLLVIPLFWEGLARDIPPSLTGP